MNPALANKIKWLPSLVIIFFILSLGIMTALAAFALVYEKKYEGRTYPGIKIAGMDVGGKTFFEAEKILSDRVNQASQNGFVLRLKDQTLNLLPVNGSSAADPARELIRWNINDPLKQAMTYGRSGNYIQRARSIINSWDNGHNIPMPAEFADELIMAQLKENFSPLENPPIDAELKYENGKFTITEDKDGITIDYTAAIKVLKAKAVIFDETATELSFVESKSAVSQADCENAGLVSKAENLISGQQFSFTDSKKTWPVKPSEIAAWLQIGLAYSFCSTTPSTLISASSTEKSFDSYCRDQSSDSLKIIADQKKVETYLKDKIAKEVEVEPVDAKFEMKNNRVSEFQTAKDGRKIDIDSTFASFEYFFLAKKASSAPLKIKEVKSSITQDSVNDLGIKEIIGTGHSNFKGSPSNRRHNIATGAKRLHGVIIDPGEEFSMIKTLGSIDAKSGYLPELVIKGNKTIPEYGGGLCQIGTTAFRAAFKSGLPITERRNHSYRVSYYEPAGTDATIYDPKPDFKFKNDTANSVLVQTRIEGNDLYFDFWGTKDGRQASSTYPKIYNIVKPGPAKLIETTDLKPGVKKCTEKAHNGADAYFDYTVTYPNGEVKKNRFSSHYIPWREVCLVGIDPAKKTASSTEAAKND